VRIFAVFASIVIMRRVAVAMERKLDRPHTPVQGFELRRRTGKSGAVRSEETSDQQHKNCKRLAKFRPRNLGYTTSGTNINKIKSFASFVSIMDGPWSVSGRVTIYVGRIGSGPKIWTCVQLKRRPFAASDA